MAKPNYIELGDRRHAQQLPILFEDRSVLAIDKPAGWMLVPHSWQRTAWNLQAAITSSIAAGDYWARARNLKFLRHIHRLDADTSGILLFARSLGALNTYGDLFETRRMEKTYLAVVAGKPAQAAWSCEHKLAADPASIGRMKVDELGGKDAETHFRVLQTGPRTTLVEARPVTGRTHQIRVHLAQSGCPVWGDELYGRKIPGPKPGGKWPQFPLGLRSVRLAYRDPFNQHPVCITAPTEAFLQEFGFSPPA